MKVLIALCLAIPFAYSKPAYLLIENHVGTQLSRKMKSVMKRKKIDERFSAVKIDEKYIKHLSHTVHDKFKKCGGYFHFDSESDLKKFVKTMKANKRRAPKDFWLLKEADTLQVKRSIEAGVKRVKESQIRKTIEKLSSFKNRYYKTKTGVSSAEWIASQWHELTQKRDDASVSLFKHEKWPQPSVILKIEGQTKEALVVGGHLDSIVGYFGGDNHAPGADDNASGIATITEIIRVITEENFRPTKTLFFMGYAAEEVGLRGSKEIAQKLANSDKYDVKGAIQFDMTNFSGSEKSIYLINDHTSEKFTTYLGTLIDRYVKVPWGYTKCGYACSDHASWNAQGIPAAFPFETQFRDSNKKIHTKQDTIDASGGHANHALNFAKLGVAAVMDFGSI